MNGNMLRDAFNLLVPAKAIESHARSLDVIRRQRKLELATLVWALVLASGSDDSGRQADAYSTYLDEADQPVVRGSFYAWFTERLERLMEALTARALAQVRKTVPHLPG